MSEVAEHIQIMLQKAEGSIPTIMELCLEEAACPSEKRRKEIGVYLGSMAHDLRSALNCAMWDFAESNLKSRFPEGEYEDIRWSHDFPIEKDKEQFEKSRSKILRYIKNDFGTVYRFLEKAQPYYDENKCLWLLKTISNYSGHTVPIEAETFYGNDVDIVGFRFKPRIVGNQVILPSPDGRSLKIYRSIPCFVPELNMFVSKERKWVIFLIGLGDQAKPGLVPFIQTASQRVNQLISEFYALW